MPKLGIADDMTTLGNAKALERNNMHNATKDCTLGFLDGGTVTQRRKSWSTPGAREASGTSSGRSHRAPAPVRVSWHPSGRRSMVPSTVTPGQAEVGALSMMISNYMFPVKRLGVYHGHLAVI
jgi:hypothetical protein